MDAVVIQHNDHPSAQLWPQHRLQVILEQLSGDRSSDQKAGQHPITIADKSERFTPWFHIPERALTAGS